VSSPRRSPPHLEVSFGNRYKLDGFCYFPLALGLKEMEAARLNESSTKVNKTTNNKVKTKFPL
jgi:hypothetical protein